MQAGGTCEFLMQRPMMGYFFVAQNSFLIFDRFLVDFASFETRAHKCSDLPAHSLLYEATCNGITLLANLTLGTPSMISYSVYVH